MAAGKQWHQTKSAFRPRTNQTSFEKRAAERIALAAIKAKEKEMKDEKEAERQVCGRRCTEKYFR
jgi:rRNA-processing protein CGR1